MMYTPFEKEMNMDHSPVHLNMNKPFNNS